MTTQATSLPAALPQCLEALAELFLANQEMVGLADAEPSQFLSAAGKKAHAACRAAAKALTAAGYTITP